MAQGKLNRTAKPDRRSVQPPTTGGGVEPLGHDERLIVLATCLFAAGLVYLATTEITLRQQFVLGWTSVLLVMLLKRSSWANKTSAGRIFLLVVVAFISLRYYVWRTFDTLIYTGPLDFIAMWLVYLAEMQVSLIHFLNMFVNLSPLQRPIAPLPADPDGLPTVDVLVPTYNEPEELVELTLIGCTQLQYPKDKLNIYLLNDGSTLERRNDPVLGATAWQRHRTLRALAESLNVHYVTRENNEDAKAGNLNAALKQSHGELLLVLDCDHVPCSDLLQNTVGWFLRDPKLYLVQTPHFFINQNPIERNLGLRDEFPGEHEMFYRANQPALDLWNSSMFCGSAGILRRKHLEEIGGVPSRTVTEDAETALTLHARGYNSAFIARPMVCGLSAETFSDFIAQRTRWCQGMLQTAIFDNPLLISGLNIPQRICYVTLVTYWLFGISRFVFFLAPTLFILFGLKVYDASIWQIVAYGLPHLIAALLSSDFLFWRYRWTLFSDLYEGVQSIFLVPAILDVINHPSKPTFKVTPKGRMIAANLRSPLSIPYLVLFMLLVISVPVAIYKWFEYPMYRDVLTLCGSWLAINILISAASLGAFLERPQGRHYHRVLKRRETLTLSDMNRSQRMAAALVDLSVTGMRITMSESLKLPIGSAVIAEFGDARGTKLSIEGHVLRRTENGSTVEYGVGFDDYRSHLPTLVSMVYGDSQVFVDWWERDEYRPGFFTSLRHLLTLARYGLSRIFFPARFFHTA